MTAANSLKDAWEALLRGDTAERDRLCDRAKLDLAAVLHARATAKVLAVDFYVSASGTVYPARDMFAASN